MNTHPEPDQSNRTPGCETNVIPFKSDAPVPAAEGCQPTDAAAEARQAEATKQFHDILLCGGGMDFGLTYEKFVGRHSTVSESDERPGAFVFSVERHRAVAGATYTKGAAMSAFETYTQRILFDSADGSITDLPDEHCGYDIDIHALAAESFEWDWKPVVSQVAGSDQKRRVEVPVSRFSFETDSYEEARRLIESHFRDLNHEIQFEGLDLPTDKESDLSSEFDDAFVKLALNALESGWAEPEPTDD